MVATATCLLLYDEFFGSKECGAVLSYTNLKASITKKGVSRTGNHITEETCVGPNPEVSHGVALGRVKCKHEGYDRAAVLHFFTIRMARMHTRSPWASLFPRAALLPNPRL